MLVIPNGENLAGLFQPLRADNEGIGVPLPEINGC
jgi:hypothetical protein